MLNSEGGKVSEFWELMLITVMVLGTPVAAGYLAEWTSK